MGISGVVYIQKKMNGNLLQKKNMWFHYLIIKLLKYQKISNDEISECYKNILYNIIKRIRRIKKFFKYNGLENSKEFLTWKQKLLDEIKK